MKHTTAFPIQPIDRHPHPEQVVARVRRQVAAQVKVDHQVARPGERVNVSGSVIQSLVDRRVDLAMQHNDRRITSLNAIHFHDNPGCAWRRSAG